LVVNKVFPVYVYSIRYYFIVMVNPFIIEHLENIIWFAMTGVEIYFVYHLIVDIGKLAEIFMKPFRRGKVKKVEKVIIMERDKHEKD